MRWWILTIELKGILIRSCSSVSDLSCEGGLLEIEDGVGSFEDLLDGMVRMCVEALDLVLFHDFF